MGKVNWIEEYYRGIMDGTFIVGKYIWLLYEYLMKGLDSGSFFYDFDKADHAVEWMEKHCFHVEGPLAPGRLKLELWQKAMLSAVFGIVDKDGKRQFREVVLVIGRKNGKSILAAGIGNYVFRELGGYGARVYCVAPKLDQADIVYNAAWVQTQLDPEWQKLKEECSVKDMHNKKTNDDSMLAKRNQSKVYITGTNSTFQKVAFNAKQSDGFNPSLAICDEIAAWEGDKGLKQYEVMRSGMGARPEALMLSCTTAGYINDSIYDELIKRSTRFLLGNTEEKKLLPFLYMIDDVECWDDIRELVKANPNIDVSITSEYLKEEIAIANVSLSKRAEFLCKHCCIKQNSSLAWLPAATVEKACGEELKLEDFKNSYCVGGIDLSQTRDLTAACVVIEQAGNLYVFSHFWLPAEKIDECAQRDGIPYQIYIQRGILSPSGDNFMDYHDCFDWFRMLVEDYEVLPLQVGYDRYSARYLVQDMEQYGFKMDDVFQGENLYPVIQETQGLLEDGTLQIGDNDLLKAHLLNSALKMRHERGRGKLIKLSPKLHIDGAAALLDAMTVRQKWYAEIGEQLKNEV